MTTLSERQLTEPVPRPRRRRALLVVAAIVLGAIVATWTVAFSPLFGARTVTVKGAHSVTAEQVRKAAAVRHGTPLVRLDTGAIARRVEQLPDVAAARVDTSFPSTVVITVTERVPIGYVRRTHGVVLVDRTGTQYHPLPRPPAGLPRFVVPTGRSARSTGGAVATVAASLPRAIRRQVESINALNPRSISLALTHGRVVRWGSAARTADKARLLPALLARRPQQIDLTDPDQPFSR